MRLARMIVAGTASRTVTMGKSARGSTPRWSAKVRQATVPIASPTGSSMDQGDYRGGHCLPGCHGCDLGPHKAEGLEGGEVAATLVGGGDQNVAEDGDSHDGQHGGQYERCGLDPCVVADVSGSLCGGEAAGKSAAEGHLTEVVVEAGMVGGDVGTDTELD